MKLPKFMSAEKLASELRANAELHKKNVWIISNYGHCRVQNCSKDWKNQPLSLPFILSRVSKTEGKRHWQIVVRHKHPSIGKCGTCIHTYNLLSLMEKRGLVKRTSTLRNSHNRWVYTWVRPGIPSMPLSSLLNEENLRFNDCKQKLYGERLAATKALRSCQRRATKSGHKTMLMLRTSGLSYREIGRRFGITRERVRQIMHYILTGIKVHPKTPA